MKIACLGDSITNLGEGITTYADLLGSESFPLTAQNVGLSGSALGVPGLPGANPALSERYVQIEKDADIILVFGGSNDYGHTNFPVTLGDPAGDDTDRATFSGALRYLITTLRRDYPNALVIYATPMIRNDAVWYKSISLDRKVREKNAFGCTLCDYREAGIAVCRAMGCPYLDTYAVPELNPLDPENCKARFRDGVHLNDAGAAFLASWFTSNIERVWNEVKG